MELKTTLNGANVTIQYEVDFSEVDCYDRATGSDYTKTVMDVTVESVMFMGVDIITTVNQGDMTALEMECTAAYDEANTPIKARKVFRQCDEEGARQRFAARVEAA